MAWELFGGRGVGLGGGYAPITGKPGRFNPAILTITNTKKEVGDSEEVHRSAHTNNAAPPGPPPPLTPLADTPRSICARLSGACSSTGVARLVFWCLYGPNERYGLQEKPVRGTILEGLRPQVRSEVVWSGIRRTACYVHLTLPEFHPER